MQYHLQFSGVEMDMLRDTSGTLSIYFQHYSYMFELKTFNRVFLETRNHSTIVQM